MSDAFWLIEWLDAFFKMQYLTGFVIQQSKVGA